MQGLSKHDMLNAAADLAAAVAVEAVAVRLVRRLRYGRRKPPRRLVRRTVAAFLEEVVREGAADTYWRRLRLRATVDRALAARSVRPAGPQRLVPRQPTPPPTRPGQARRLGPRRAVA